MLTVLLACSSKSKKGPDPIESNESIEIDTTQNDDTISLIETDEVLQPIIGERIHGPANIRDTINGELIFTLYDNTLVTSTEPEHGWYMIGLMMDIDTSEFGIDHLEKGRKIIVGGKEVGEIKSDLEVSTATTRREAWATLVGYTHNDNLREETIVEREILKYFENGGDRSFGGLMDIIDRYDLEADDQFVGYTVFYNYENWLDDPSPMWRIGLVFENDRLISILHSRSLPVPGASDYALDRGFNCMVFDDVEYHDYIVAKFNRFVNSVD